MVKKRLTQGLRCIIKNSILSDVPTTDYDSLISDYVNKQAFSQLPAALKARELEEYLGEKYIRDFGVYVRNAKYTPTEEDKNFVRTQKALNTTQHEKLRELRISLEVLLESFKYVEDIAEQAPEFVKYIPTEQKPITNLPAVQLTQQLTALGWPKGDEGK